MSEKNFPGGNWHRRAATKSPAQLAESFAANVTAELDNAGWRTVKLSGLLLRVVWR